MAITLDRNLDAAVVSATKDNNLVAVPVLYLDFANSGFQKYFAGAGMDIDIPTNPIMPSGTYLGVGGISAVSAAEESAELKAGGLTVTLNGIDSTYVSLVLSEQYYGGEAKLALVILNTSNYSIIGNPVIIFKGFMSVLTVDLGKDKADITVELENILADWERPRVSRYNNASQAAIDPNDKGFSNVSKIVTKEIVWEEA